MLEAVHHVVVEQADARTLAPRKNSKTPATMMTARCASFPRCLAACGRQRLPAASAWPFCIWPSANIGPCPSQTTRCLLWLPRHSSGHSARTQPATPEDALTCQAGVLQSAARPRTSTHVGPQQHAQMYVRRMKLLPNDARSSSLPVSMPGHSVGLELFSSKQHRHMLPVGVQTHVPEHIEWAASGATRSIGESPGVWQACRGRTLTG
jgi:hypothetical protein